jgi:hypothetical protein
VHSSGGTVSVPSVRRFSDLATVAVEPDWLWEGFLASGQVTMLAGDSFAGKSTLVTGLLAAMARGDRFLGRATRCGTALLLSEETDQQLAARAHRFETLGSAHGVLTRTDGIAECGWEELIEHATAHALARDHGLLVIDTFAGLARLEKDDENDAGAVTKRLRPLVVAGGKGLAVLLLHHTNKWGGVRGSQAFRATVDISVHLSRSKHSSKLAIATESRHIDIEAGKLSAWLATDARPWRYVTHAPERPPVPRRDASSTRAAVLRALTTAGPRGATYAELAVLPSLSKSKVKRCLPGLYDSGLVDRDGAGTKSDPYRWTLATNDQAPNAMGGDAAQ